MSFLNRSFTLPGTGARIKRNAENLLRVEAEDHIDRATSIKDFTENVLNNNFKAFLLICDAFCVLAMTLLLLSVGAQRCEEEVDAGDIPGWCQPFQTVDRVLVDFSFKLRDCDEPRACVAYAQKTTESHGFSYNFILGKNHLVYVGKGYQCWSEALRIQMMIRRYVTEGNNTTLFDVQEDVVIRYSEIIQEGVDCGFIRPNFTVTAFCPIYGEWCGAQNVRELPWDRPEQLAWKHHYRKDWLPPAHQPEDHPFTAFDTQRVYADPYRLRACNTSRSQ